MTRSSFPDDPETISRPGDWSDLPIFSAPPPSGPQTPVPSREAGKRAAYLAWKRSTEGGRAFGWIITAARRQMLGGARRVSTKALVEECRAELKVELNNSYTGWLADDLVAADDRLLPLIERRTRRKAQA